MDEKKNKCATAQHFGAMLFVAGILGGCMPETCDINSSPDVDAGDDFTVATGEEVTLDGSASFDLNDDELSYEWEQRRGPVEVALSSLVEPTTTVVPIIAGLYEFRLTVRDGCEGFFSTGSQDFVLVEVQEICIDSADCDDGLFCNGPEVCVAFRCLPGESPCDAADVCNEQIRLCEGTPKPSNGTWMTSDDPYWPGLYPVTFEFDQDGEIISVGISPGTPTALALLELAGFSSDSFTIEELSPGADVLLLGESTDVVNFQATSAFVSGIAVDLRMRVDRLTLSVQDDGAAVMNFDIFFDALFNSSPPIFLTITSTGTQTGTFDSGTKTISWTEAVGEVVTETGSGPVTTDLTEFFTAAPGSWTIVETSE